MWGDDEKVVLAIYDGIFAYLLFVNFGTYATACKKYAKKSLHYGGVPKNILEILNGIFHEGGGGLTNAERKIPL